MGNDNPQLNSLLAQAFPLGRALGSRGQILRQYGGRGRTDEGRKGCCGRGSHASRGANGQQEADQGHIQVDSVARNDFANRLEGRLQARQDKGRCQGRELRPNRAQSGGCNAGLRRGHGRQDPAKKKATYEPFEESTKHTRIDFHPWHGKRSVLRCAVGPGEEEVGEGGDSGLRRGLL